jgi:pilus assembly protein FimV
MIVRFTPRDFVRQSVRFAFGKTTAIAMACALFGAPAHAATTDAAASASVAASAPAAASQAIPLSGEQYTVKAGQSLNDVAIDVTQSHDRSVLTHAAKALFDANPKAFMGGDPSRMRVGAVLNVPSLDATGNIAASGTEAAETASGVAASGVTAASAVAPASSVAAQANAASASAAAQAASNPGAASAALPASAAATGAIQQPASAPAEASASEGGASAPAVAAASAASSAQPHVSSLQQLLALKNRVLMALQQHGFGPAQPQAGNRAPATGAPASAGQQTLAANSASGVAVAAAPVSSPAVEPAPRVAGGELSFNGWQINIGALSAAIAAFLVLVVGLVMRSRKRAAAAAAAASAADERMEKRVRAVSDSAESAPAEKPAIEQAADDASADVSISQQGRDASHDTAKPSSDDAVEADLRAILKDSPNSKSALMSLVSIYAERRDVARFDEVAQRIWQLSAGRGPNWRHVASLGRQLDPHNPLYADAGGVPGASLGSLESSDGGVSSFDTQEQESAEPASGEALGSAEAQEPLAETKADAEAEGSQIEPPSTTAQAEEEAAPDEETAVPPAAHAEAAIPHDEEPAPQAEEPESAATTDAAAPHAADTESRANDAASRTNEIAARLEAMAAAVEAAKSLESETAPHEEAATPPAPELTWPHAESDEPAAKRETLEPASPEPPVVHAQAASPQDADADFPVPHIEPSFGETEHHAPPQDTADEFAPPPSFPSEALSALNSLDLSLPPRLETESAGPLRASQGDIAVPSPVSLTTQPVVAPEITEQQAVPPFAPEPPHAADAIEAGIAGPAAVAGLGAARFGAMNLNFDLDLPASTSPLPTFTPEELAKIARNKLDLASEYIELGDIAGARTLINEVIESNDAATRNDARAMLSTLAPLS